MTDVSYVRSELPLFRVSFPSGHDHWARGSSGVRLGDVHVGSQASAGSSRCQCEHGSRATL